MAPTKLTKREDEIRRLVVDGLTNDAIAAELGISARTVEAHLRMLFRKMGASRREQLADAPAADAGLAPQIRRDPADDELKRQLDRRESQLEAYDGAIRRLIDRQFPLYDERMEITLVVGSRPSEDMVVERHWTKPNPYVVYRVMRPIYPHDLPPDDMVSLLGMSCEVTGADANASVDVLPDLDGRPLAVVLFRPGLSGPTEWQLRYRAPGLWDPLRATGEDALTWAAGTLDGRHAEGLQRFVLRVEFPPGASDVELVEGRGVGHVEDGDGEPPTLVFIDESRTGGLYSWGLRMSVG